MGSRYSLRNLGLKAKIPSSGYLSEVFRGNRLLGKKHGRGLFQALGLRNAELTFALHLLERDHTTDAAKKIALDATIENARKSLGIKGHKLSSNIEGLFFAIEVFSALSMFGNTASTSDLLNLYGDHRRSSLNNALKILREFGMIADADESELQSRDEKKSEDRKFKTVQPLAHFVAGLDSSFYEQFMQSVLNDATQKLRTWFRQRDFAVFSTSVVSVNVSKYKTAVPQIKQKILDIVSDLETSPADGLVRLNLQMFPMICVEENQK